jgi:IS30 family transposase
MEKDRILEPHERSLGGKSPYSNEERRRIKKLINDGHNQRSIAKMIGRSSKSLNAEVKRHSMGNWKNYDAEYGINLARENYKKRGWSLYLKRNNIPFEELKNKVKELCENGYTRHRIKKELTIGYSVIQKIFIELGLKETGIYGNEKRLTFLEEKIDYISNSIDIILEVLKPKKE